MFSPPPQMLNSPSGAIITGLITEKHSPLENPKVRRIKSRLDRRSDQRRNRALRDFNLIEMIEYKKPESNIDNGTGKSEYRINS